jgi:polar amino acid transport system permease protein
MYHFDFRPVIQNFDLLLQGLLLSIGLALLSLAVGTVLGLLAAFARVYGPRRRLPTSSLSATSRCC